MGGPPAGSGGEVSASPAPRQLVELRLFACRYAFERRMPRTSGRILKPELVKVLRRSFSSASSSAFIERPRNDD